MTPNTFVLSLFIIFIAILSTSAKESGQKKKSWRDKDIRDMTEADLEHILEQWEENDEPLEPDELPEHLRPTPKIDVSKIDTKNPDDMLKLTKRGRSVMMFIDLVPELTDEQIEDILRIWQSGLQNNHIVVERYPIDARRSIFMFREGSQAVDAKNYLLQQPELSHLTIEGQTYYANIQQLPETYQSKKQKEKTKDKTKDKTKEEL